MSKGSHPRPFGISRKQFDKNFEEVFGDTPSSFCVHHVHKDMKCRKCDSVKGKK